MTSPKTGLFSATVAAFIIEFYKKLDPVSDSNTADQSSPPSASMIWVNAMWLISLVLSLTSALVATLFQQWGRRYLETPNIPNEPNDGARVRVFLFHGTKKYKMHHAIEIVPILLHLSVFLFFGGLVITFHTINTKVAIAVDVAVGILALPYIVITVIPFLDIRCPYRTPISLILWYPLHAFLSIVTRGLCWILEQVDGCCSILDRLPTLDGIATLLEEAAQKHWECYMGGFANVIIQSAKNPLKDGAREIIDGDYEIIDEDREAITWLFSHLALSDKSKLRELAADIPRNKIPNLIPFIKSGNTIALREPLLTLLRSCATDKRAAESDGDVRNRSLLVCLDIIHHIAKSPVIPELNFMRANFANIDLMRALWSDDDTTIRVTSRSICALLAKQVVRQGLGEPQIVWLEAVIGDEFDRIRMYHSDFQTRDRMILKPFLHKVLLNQDGEPDLPTESFKCFKETLAILLDVGTDVDYDMVASKEQLEREVGWIQQQLPQGNNIVDKFRPILPFQLHPVIPPAP